MPEMNGEKTETNMMKKLKDEKRAIEDFEEEEARKCVRGSK